MVALSDYVFYADHDAKNKVSSRKLTCPLILKKKKTSNSFLIISHAGMFHKLCWSSIEEVVISFNKKMQRKTENVAYFGHVVKKFCHELISRWVEKN